MERKKTNEKIFSLRYLLLITIILVVCIGIVVFFIRKDVVDTGDGNDKVAAEKSSQMDNVDVSDVESITISTDYGDLYYPEQWNDYLTTTQTWEGNSLVITFSAAIRKVEYPMFYVTIGSSDDTLVGKITDKSDTKHDVYMAVDEIKDTSDLSDEELQRVYAMQEDLNYVIDHLE